MRHANPGDDAQLVSVLFSEPKIPQLHRSIRLIDVLPKFQCSSASRKFLNRQSGLHFSATVKSFSALQRAENSSIQSATPTESHRWCFSALQRAENSSMARQELDAEFLEEFQCSSASRKFLNNSRAQPAALQLQFQCSSASRKFLNTATSLSAYSICSFQCSSASRKFLNRRGRSRSIGRARVSVLFSEPKIPQFQFSVQPCVDCRRFSALQRAENSSISPFVQDAIFSIKKFQCSSASRKFLNSVTFIIRLVVFCVSVLFSEPKIPQFAGLSIGFLDNVGFSALQRAENSSIVCGRATDIRAVGAFQCSSASRKFLNLVRSS